MPIYDFKCTTCEREWDELMKAGEVPADCKYCGHHTVEKMVSRTNFRLKGAGWYETDFKKGEKRNNLHEYGQGCKRDE